MAPQQPLPEKRRLLMGIVDKIVRRGRVRGSRPMITQRPAVIHKNVLS